MFLGGASFSWLFYRITNYLASFCSLPSQLIPYFFNTTGTRMYKNTLPDCDIWVTKGQKSTQRLLAANRLKNFKSNVSCMINLLLP